MIKRYRLGRVEYGISLKSIPHEKPWYIYLFLMFGIEV